MMPSSRRFHLLILLVAFIVSVLFRLPNLNRPISKHHEFNTAVILNGIISWKEAGGASQFSYTPLMTYPGEANRLLQRGPYVDEQGNQIYLSLGPGWYVFPYVAFTAFHLPFTVLSLQLLNLFIHLCTLLVLYRLAVVVLKGYPALSPQFPLYTCLVFLFMPGPLWYFGNGYVHAAISLPFAIIVFTQYLQWYWGQSRLNATTVAMFSLAGIAGIYLDWFTFFLLGVLAFHAGFLFIQKRKGVWLKVSLLSGGVAVIAVALIFYQFVSYAGIKKVTDYWVSRGAERSFDTGDVSWLQRWMSIGINLATCAGIVLMTVPFALWFMRKRETPLLPLMLWLSTCILYNCIFFNWSSDHEFSMVPVCIGISLTAAYLLQRLRPARLAAIALTVVCALNMVQYYFINPPGKMARAGIPYNEHQRLGEEIRNRVPADYRIFSNLGNDPMTEYYAHHSFVQNKAATAAIAQRIANSLKVPKAVWLRIDSLQIKEIQLLK